MGCSGNGEGGKGRGVLADEARKMKDEVSLERPPDKLGAPSESTGTSLVLEDRCDKLTETMALVQARHGKSPPWHRARGGRGREAAGRAQVQKAQRRTSRLSGQQGERKRS